MKPGELYWSDFGTRGGHAQAGRRPAIIVQLDDATEQLPTVLVIPLTTQLTTVRYPGTATIVPDGQNGLKKSSVALAFQMGAVDKRSIYERIGELTEEDFRRVVEALDAVLARI